MRIYFIHEDHESGPYTIDDVRDRLLLKMVAPNQPCRITQHPGTYVAGEIVAGSVFREWEAVEEDDETDDDDDEGAEEKMRVYGPESDEQDEDRDEGESDKPKNHKMVSEGRDDGDWPPSLSQRESSERTPSLVPQNDIHSSPVYEEEHEDEEALLWYGHPGLGAFPLNLVVSLFLATLAVLVGIFDWSGWLAMGFGSTACFLFALLLARRQSTRYALFENHLEVSDGLWFGKVREYPRYAVQAIDVKMTLFSAMRMRGDLVFHLQLGNGSEIIQFKNIFRPRRVRKYWRA